MVVRKFARLVLLQLAVVFVQDGEAGLPALFLAIRLIWLRVHLRDIVFHFLLSLLRLFHFFICFIKINLVCESLLVESVGYLHVWIVGGVGLEAGEQAGEV